MTIDEFRNALRALLSDAAKSGLSVDDLQAAAVEELHPEAELESMMKEVACPHGHLDWDECPACNH